MTTRILAAILISLSATSALASGSQSSCVAMLQQDVIEFRAAGVNASAKEISFRSFERKSRARDTAPISTEDRALINGMRSNRDLVFIEQEIEGMKSYSAVTRGTCEGVLQFMNTSAASAAGLVQGLENMF